MFFFFFCVTQHGLKLLTRLRSIPGLLSHDLEMGLWKVPGCAWEYTAFMVDRALHWMKGVRSLCQGSAYHSWWTQLSTV